MDMHFPEPILSFTWKESLGAKLSAAASDAMVRGSGLRVPPEAAPYHSQPLPRSSRYSHMLFQLPLTPEMRQRGGNRKAGWELFSISNSADSETVT